MKHLALKPASRLSVAAFLVASKRQIVCDFSSGSSRIPNFVLGLRGVCG